jgi:bifunctional non-homologous end joining protein LigD
LGQDRVAGDPAGGRGRLPVPGRGRYAGTVGGLLVGVHDRVDGRLRYVGSVGTGFSDRDRDRLHALLIELAQHDSPFDVPVPPAEASDAHWVAAELVGDVQHREWIRPDGRLRAPSWRGLRADLTPDDVHASFSPDTSTDAIGTTQAPKDVERKAGPAGRVVVRVDDRQLTLSNLDKVLYPATGFTKANVIDYYRRIAPVLLPLLHNRPVTFIIRYPDGVTGQSFFEKNAPRHAPTWVHTVRLPSGSSRPGHSGRGDHRGDHIAYVLINDLPTLVWAANLAALELHVPQWTIDSNGHQTLDRLVFDLDPGADTMIVECCRVAERLHDLLVADGLAPVAKTSGSKGLQLYAGIHTPDAKRPSAYAKALAEHLVAETPDLVVAKMAKNLRRGRVSTGARTTPRRPPSRPTRCAAVPALPCPHPLPGTRFTPVVNQSS